MTKIFKVLLAAVVLTIGSTAPAHFTPQIEYRETFYADLQGTVSGVYTVYCDGSSTFVGHPDIYDYVEYFGC